MRVGFHPQKSKQLPKTDFFHQIVVPVHIPTEEDYFRDGLKILKICLGSIIKSSHKKTFITVIDNGSCENVRNYLDGLYRSGEIHELMHTESIGKINAIFKGIIGHDFPLVTITDADVLYINGWQQAGYDLFDAFPEAGVVCTTPLSRRAKYHMSNLFFDRFFSKNLTFTPVKDAVSMQDFADSIGDKRLLREIHLKKNLTITENGKSAVVGAGHFTSTYKGSIFKQINFSTSDNFLGGDSEGYYLDRPVTRKGYWRLSTEENFTWHMGNVHESWMDEKLADIHPQSDMNSPSLREQSISRLTWLIKSVWFAKLVYSHRFWKKFQQFKGLTKAEAADY